MTRHGLRVLGHPAHPILTAFPIALWTSSVLWDLIGLVRDEPLWAQMAYWCLVLGLAASVLTVITGFIDFLALSGDDLVERLATRHMMAALSAASLFTVSLILRHFRDTPYSALPLLFSAAGLLVLMVAGWYGGELVFSHAVAVKRPVNETDPSAS